MIKKIVAPILALGVLASCKQAIPITKDYSNVMFDIPQIEYSIELSDLEKVLQFVKQRIAYTKDGEEDYWATPDETFNSSKGDCEDFVSLDMYLLKRDFGRDSKMIVGIEKRNIGKSNSAHALLMVDGTLYETQDGLEKSLRDYKVLNEYSYSDVIGMITNGNKGLEVVD